MLKKGVVKVELNKELLKGHIDTLILAILEKNDSYGFEIAKNVLNKTTFELKDGTLYISLKRMEFCKKYNGRILEGEKLIWKIIIHIQ